MSQNDWLSTYFGDDVAEDLEKTAQALMLTKLAEDAGLDLNQLSEEELMQLVAELQMNLEGQQDAQPGAPQAQPGMAPGMTHPQGQMGMQNAAQAQGLPHTLLGQQMQRPQQMAQQAPQGQPVGQAPAATAGGLSPEMAKEAQAKFEEADALGRVMAHAYVEELEKIASAREQEKTAGIKDKAQALGGVAKAHLARGSSSKVRSAIDHVGRNKGRYGAGAAAVGGFAAGRASKKEKTASAFEKIANDRALEILQTLGIDPTGGQEPEQAQDVDFGTAVDQRALQILADAGYDPNEVATAYDQTVGGEVPQQ